MWLGFESLEKVAIVWVSLSDVWFGLVKSGIKYRRLCKDGYSSTNCININMKALFGISDSPAVFMGHNSHLLYKDDLLASLK